MRNWRALTVTLMLLQPFYPTSIQGNGSQMTHNCRSKQHIKLNLQEHIVVLCIKLYCNDFWYPALCTATAWCKALDYETLFLYKRVWHGFITRIFPCMPIYWIWLLCGKHETQWLGSSQKKQNKNCLQKNLFSLLNSKDRPEYCLATCGANLAVQDLHVA